MEIESRRVLFRNTDYIVDSMAMQSSDASTVFCGLSRVEVNYMYFSCLLKRHRETFGMESFWHAIYLKRQL